jgi:hypothetical protein
LGVKREPGGALFDDFILLPINNAAFSGVFFFFRGSWFLGVGVAPCRDVIRTGSRFPKE